MICIIFAPFFGGKKIFDSVVPRKIQLNQDRDKILKVIPLRQHYGEITKQFALIFFPISILIGAVLVNSYYREVGSRKKFIKIEEKRVVEVKKILINNSFVSLILDVQNLAKLPYLKEYFDGRKNSSQIPHSHLGYLDGRKNSSQIPHSHLEHIEEQLVAFAKYQQLYYQVLLLDTTGQEIIRVSYENGEA
ncbi:MAG: hypothetical protein F6K17_32850, partial [Okeania sp. SIO3C4]|nr:hypothetical protein [Okeania sp. SIO3C4]